MAYPTTIQTFTNVTATTDLGADDHAGRHNQEGSVITALENVLGTTAGTSIAKNFAAGEFAERVGKLTFDSVTYSLGATPLSTNYFLQYNGTNIAGGSAIANANNIPGTISRVDDNTIQVVMSGTSIADQFSYILGKSTPLRWNDGTTFMRAVSMGGSVNSNTVTVITMGSAYGTGATNLQYSMFKARSENFMIVGNLGTAAGTNVSKFWPFPCSAYLYGVTVNVQGTANGTSNFDVNINGTSRFTVKPTINGTQTTANFVGDTINTEIPKGGTVTIDIDSGGGTPAVDANIELWYIPVSWRYQ